MALVNRKSEIGNRKSRRAGVTLIEVVIAIFVLSVGIIGVISLFPSGYRLSQAAMDRSVAALAAQDAIARIVARSKETGVTLPNTADPLYKIRERDRVGTVKEVLSASQISCYVRGDQDPQWPALSGYFLLMTSGTAAGSVYSASLGGNSITVSGVALRYATARTGEPVRVGDHFAIIGSTTGTLNCFPVSPSFLGASEGRTQPIATEGDSAKKWLYSYGAIVSAPSPEMNRVYRVDIFVYRNFATAATSLGAQGRPAGYIVTYLPKTADYDFPGQ